MLTPLAVAQQMVAEGVALGITVTSCREEKDIRPGVNVTNYERLHKFDPTQFAGVVPDESSCIKHHDSKTSQQMIDTFRSTEFKLFCTATPAPNDWVEFGTHAEALGVCSRVEMLSEFFVHDGGETSVWHLKGHAKRAFWKWVSEWGALLRSPADLGFDGSMYVLPKLTVIDHLIKGDRKPADGSFFTDPARSLMERRAARKESTDDRVAQCANIVNAEDHEPWVVWCDLNAESDALTRSIPGAIEVRGSMDIDDKEERVAAFASGKARVLVTKPSICGWGVNWQHCARQAFVGVTDSYEAQYQAVRRSWRFGQKRPVFVHRFFSDAETEVIDNLRRKETDADAMSEALSAETRAIVMGEVLGMHGQTNKHDASQPVVIPSFI
jgi:hypothetical protein